MNFDLLITLLFIFFFVLGPLLRRITGGQQQPGPDADRRPGRDQPTTGGRTAAPDREEASTQQASDGNLSQRLEEARRRVLEAMGESDGGSRPVAPPATPRPSAAGQGTRAGSARPQSRQLDWQEVVKPVESFMSSRRAPVRTTLRSESGAVITAPPLRTERRRKAPKPATMSVGRGFGLEREAIKSGIIWHEILSEPVSKRGNRRRLSRLRSR